MNDEELRAKAKELYINHTSVAAISEITGVPVTTLRGWIYVGTQGEEPWKNFRPKKPIQRVVEPGDSLDKPDPKEALKYLNRIWQPHSGQEQARQAVFESIADLVYVECGRKFGKSEFATWACWLMAVSKPNSEIYYLAPAVKQAKELVWANFRMQTCNSYSPDFKKEIEALLGGEIKIKDQEMRIYLPNNSFIKVDGSDNYNLQRGLKPDFVVADEYRDFKPQWIEAVRPNMAVKSGKMLFITTPPPTPNHAYELAAEARENADGHSFYLNLPSNVNDKIPNHDKWLERENARLLRSGRENEWRREYLAEFIPNDENMVIPQLNSTLCIPEKDIEPSIVDRIHRLESYVAVHTGQSARFTALAAFYDPYESKIYVVDALVEENPEKTSMTEIWPKLQRMISKAGMSLNDCHFVYNRKAAWFGRDLSDIFDIAAQPSTQFDELAENNISLIKDIIISESLVVSEKASELTVASSNFSKDPVTFKIPNECPQLISCLKYIVSASGYTTKSLKLPEIKPADENWVEALLKAPPIADALADKLAEKYGIIDFDI